nr:hypothetical protein HmN_000898800 [Hymenolepis microstoma]
MKEHGTTMALQSYQEWRLKTDPLIFISEVCLRLALVNGSFIFFYNGFVNNDDPRARLQCRLEALNMHKTSYPFIVPQEVLFIPTLVPLAQYCLSYPLRLDP